MKKMQEEKILIIAKIAIQKKKDVTGITRVTVSVYISEMNNFILRKNNDSLFYIV